MYVRRYRFGLRYLQKFLYFVDRLGNMRQSSRHFSSLRWGSIMRRALRLAMAICLIFSSAALARADEQADALVIVNKAIEAIGGEAKLKLTATTFKMKFTQYEQDVAATFTGDVSYQSEEKFRQEGKMETAGRGYDWIMLVNGDKGWDIRNGQPLEMSPERLSTSKENLYSKGLARLIVLKDKAIKLSRLGESQVNGRPALGVRAKHATYRDVDLFFDKETHLLAKMVRKTPWNRSETNEEIFFSDYTEDVPGGATYPSRITIMREGKVVWEEERSGLKRHEKLHDKLFEKP